MNDLIGNLCHIITVLDILVIKTKDISEDQKLNIDKKKIMAIDLINNAQFTLTTILELSGRDPTTRVNADLDHELLNNYEQMIRRSVLWQ